MAPEIIQNKSYSGEEVDLFACGVFLFTTYMGWFPFAIASR